MSIDRPQKILADHLKRDAFLYVRQSSLRQVFENSESTKRQYALRERAVALGWPLERIRTIDSDLGPGRSGCEPGRLPGLVGEWRSSRRHRARPRGIAACAQQRRLASLLELARSPRPRSPTRTASTIRAFNDRLLFGPRNDAGRPSCTSLEGTPAGRHPQQLRRGDSNRYCWVVS
jgi:hypothetical protein